MMMQANDAFCLAPLLTLLLARLRSLSLPGGFPWRTRWTW
jgi:hypothetical protein